jgi:hypothetical protein
MFSSEVMNSLSFVSWGSVAPAFGEQKVKHIRLDVTYLHLYADEDGRQ